jgi:hypothetical protein
MLRAVIIIATTQPINRQVSCGGWRAAAALALLADPHATPLAAP